MSLDASAAPVSALACARAATPRHASTRRPGMSETYWAHIRDLAEMAPPLTAAQRHAIRQLTQPLLGEIAA